MLVEWTWHGGRPTFESNLNVLGSNPVSVWWGTFKFCCLNGMAQTSDSGTYGIYNQGRTHFWGYYCLWMYCNPLCWHGQVIAAEGEMNASRALKEASLVIAESPSALQLRYLQTLTTIAAEKNSTIIFPLPIDMMQQFVRKSWWDEDAEINCWNAYLLSVKF